MRYLVQKELWRLQKWIDVKIFYEFQIFRGGGSYNEEGNGIKIGKWIEISERFREDS